MERKGQSKMGMFDKAASKLKSIFIEEIPEETKPIKKEVIKVPIPAPEEEIEKEERETLAKDDKEDKFVFPVYMDEEDEIDPKEDLVKELAEKKESEKKDSFRDFGSEYENKSHSQRERDLIAAFNESGPVVANTKKSSYEEDIKMRIESYTRSNGEKKEVVVPQKKNFVPTPIISPVYGVLDQNYSKDDIATKKSAPKLSSTLESNELSIDNVRMKAFGTLEEEIDSSLFDDDIATNFSEDGLMSDIDMEDNLLNEELEKAYEEELEIAPIIENPRSKRKPKIEIEPDEDNMIEEMLSRNYDVEEDESKSSATEENEDLYMSENDLFNLIDSMYEKRDDE